ncbi:DUF6263 family protein [Tenacibaculum sp. TC6]|uniref:DUF6263 family protein n=1 Tax=Tenacibaculum sp. TC6 TaxID=3423223 RepID=UPI003D364479
MTKKIMALLLFVSTITMAQEKVLLRLKYEKGDSYTMNMKMAQVMGMGVMTTDMNIQMKYDITNVSSDTYESTSKFTKMVMDMKQGAMQVSYDSTKKDEELDETGKMMKSQMAPMLEATILMKGDKLGKVLETKVEPNVPGAGEFTDQSSNVIYPEKAVAVGDSWTMTKSNKGMDLNFTYKVKTISAKNVVLDVSGKVSGIAEGDITGSMNIDRKSGVLTESKINMAMKVQGQDLSTNLTINQTKI